MGDDDMLIDAADAAMNAEVLKKYTVRVNGYVPVYTFVREDEEQAFDVILEPFSETLLARIKIGTIDDDAVRAIAGYGASMVDQEGGDATESEA